MESRAVSTTPFQNPLSNSNPADIPDSTKSVENTLLGTVEKCSNTQKKIPETPNDQHQAYAEQTERTCSLPEASERHLKKENTEPSPTERTPEKTSHIHEENRPEIQKVPLDLRLSEQQKLVSISEILDLYMEHTHPNSKYAPLTTDHPDVTFQILRNQDKQPVVAELNIGAIGVQLKIKELIRSDSDKKEKGFNFQDTINPLYKHLPLTKEEKDQAKSSPTEKQKLFANKVKGIVLANNDLSGISPDLNMMKMLGVDSLPEEKQQFLVKHPIALWEWLASCILVKQELDELVNTFKKAACSKNTPDMRLIELLEKFQQNNLSGVDSNNDSEIFDKTIAIVAKPTDRLGALIKTTEETINTSDELQSKLTQGAILDRLMDEMRHALSVDPKHLTIQSGRVCSLDALKLADGILHRSDSANKKREAIDVDLDFPVRKLGEAPISLREIAKKVGLPLGAITSRSAFTKMANAVGLDTKWSKKLTTKDDYLEFIRDSIIKRNKPVYIHCALDGGMTLSDKLGIAKIMSESPRWKSEHWPYGHSDRMEAFKSFQDSREHGIIIFNINSERGTVDLIATDKNSQEYPLRNVKIETIIKANIFLSDTRSPETYIKTKEKMKEGNAKYHFSSPFFDKIQDLKNRGIAEITLPEPETNGGFGGYLCSISRKSDYVKIRETLLSEKKSENSRD